MTYTHTEATNMYPDHDRSSVQPREGAA
jgi:hypothetical protein